MTPTRTVTRFIQVLIVVKKTQDCYNHVTILKSWHSLCEKYTKYYKILRQLYNKLRSFNNLDWRHSILLPYFFLTWSRRQRRHGSHVTPCASGTLIRMGRIISIEVARGWHEAVRIGAVGHTPLVYKQCIVGTFT